MKVECDLKYTYDGKWVNGYKIKDAEEIKENQLKILYALDVIGRKIDMRI